MALETNVDPSSQIRQLQAQATLPSAAADSNGMEPTSTSPTGNQLTPPAVQPTPPPLQLQSSVTTPAAAPSPNKGLHSFISSFLSSSLGALAGKPPTKYVTNADGQVIPAPVQPKDTLGDKGRRLAATALTGLGAGSQVQPQKSGLANALAGIGAGASAVDAKTKAADDKARQQERENEEAKQQKMLRMHEIARGNALTASTWQHMMDEEQDRDPARAQHVSWAKAAEDAGVPVKYVTESEAHQIRVSDPETLAKFQVLPVGMETLKDNDGNVIVDESGKPKMQGKFALIDGLHDGNLAAPQSFVDDVKKYAKYAGVSGEDSLKSGDDLSMQHFIKLANSIQEGKKKEVEGWAKPEQGFVNGKPVQINSNTRATRDYPEGVVPNVENKAADTEQQRKLREAETNRANAETNEANAKTQKLKQDADQEKSFNLAGSGNLTGPEYLKTLPLAQQSVLKAIAEGRETRSPRQLQGKDGNPTPLAEALHRAYSDFDDKKAAAYGAVLKDFTSGATSRGLTAYGTAINHARALYDNTDLKSYIPGTDEYKRYNQDIAYVATEVAKALNPTGVATEGAIKEQENALRSYTNRKAAIENAEHILTGKMAEVKQRWLNAQVRPSYQPAMPGLSKEAMDNADYIRNHGKVQQPAQNPQTGQTQNQTPAPTTHSVSISTAMKNHPGMTEEQVRTWAKQNNYEVAQ